MTTYFGATAPPYTGISGVTGVISFYNSTTIPGGAVYAYCSSIQVSTEAKEDEEPVIGTPYPIINDGAFHGEGSMELIWSSEASGQLDILMQRTNGAIPFVSFKIYGKDMQGNGQSKTWTSTIKPKKSTLTGSGTNWFKSKMDFLTIVEPTLGTS